MAASLGIGGDGNARGYPWRVGRYLTSEWTGLGMHPIVNSLSGSRVGVVGAGRVGTALAAALRAVGVDVAGPFRRGELVSGATTSGPRFDAVVLCVPDGEISAAAADVAGTAPLVGHTSGATPLSALEPAGADRFGLHPLQTVPAGSGAGVFQGAGAAVAGSTPAALAFAADLARAARMTPFEIDDDGRAAYHAAASVASNFLVTLQAAAEQIAASAGLEPHEARALLIPLLRRTVDNLAELGPERALTGPIARGDDATVEAQRQAVAEAAPQLLDLFDELVRHTRALARQELSA